MKVARFKTTDGEVFAGTVFEDHVVPLLPGEGARGEWAVVDLLMGAAKSLAGLPPIAIEEVRFLAPIAQPRALRDFYAFEAHVATANKGRGREVPPQWYEEPVFYFSNPNTIIGHGDSVRAPAGSSALDYELEIAAVIGRDLRDATAAEAEEAICGFTIFNDFSARDLQMAEMSVGLGPAKGKDFASAFGPYVVSPDELGDVMTASVNGIEYSRGKASDIHWSWGEIVAHASRDSRVARADLIGSGTVGTGCILELSLTHGADKYPWLSPGDRIDLSIEGIGTLTNFVEE